MSGDGIEGGPGDGSSARMGGRGGGGVVAWLVSAEARADLPIEVEPIKYLTAPVDDPIARLQKRIDAGEVSLSYDEKRGYLPAVLELLKIPKSSQVLVFSKTSFQHTKISRTRPACPLFQRRDVRRLRPGRRRAGVLHGRPEAGGRVLPAGSGGGREARLPPADARMPAVPRLVARRRTSPATSSARSCPTASARRSSTPGRT